MSTASDPSTAVQTRSRTGAVSAVLGWLAPARTGLLLVVATLPLVAFDPRDGFDGYFGVKTRLLIVLGLALGVWWAVALRAGAEHVDRMPVPLALGLLLAGWATLAALVSASPSDGVWGSPGRDDGLLVLLANLAVLVTAVSLRDRQGWRWILRAATAVCFLLAAVGVAQHFGLDPSGLPTATTYGRSTATFRNPLFFAGYLSLMLPICLGVAAGAGRAGTRLALAAGVGVVLAALVFTYSRGAWIGTAFGLAVLVAAVALRARGSLVHIGLVMSVAVVVAAGVVLVPRASLTGAQEHSLAADGRQALSISAPRNAGRLAIWHISLRMIADHPWTGVGPDQMGAAFAGYRTPAFDVAEGPATIADRAHSEPLHLAVTLGVPGALLALALIASLLWRGRSRLLGLDALLWAGVLAGILGYLAQSLVSITVPGVHTLFFLLLGGFAAVGANTRKGGETRMERHATAQHVTDVRRRTGEHGFTLIELLVVIIIIAILAGIAIPVYLGARIKAQDAAAVNLVRNALTIVESAHVEQRDYRNITAPMLTAIEPAIGWRVSPADLVDPTVPTVTAAVTSLASNRQVDFYPQDATTYDVASLSASGNRYGIQVVTTGMAGASYVKVKVIEGESSIGW